MSSPVDGPPPPKGATARRVDTWHRPGEAVALFVRGATVRTAGPTALIVGTVLSLVNQGAVIFGGQGDGWTWVRVMVNFLVPFAVASIGFLAARRRNTGPTGRGGID
ncbi:MAG: nitrate/nitrite transporter NrtS [Mycobacterium sp.]